MSRHKLIKNMDLDDELDDFDGGEDYDYDGVEATEGMLFLFHVRFWAQLTCACLRRTL